MFSFCFCDPFFPEICLVYWLGKTKEEIAVSVSVANHVIYYVTDDPKQIEGKTLTPAVEIVLVGFGYCAALQ